MRIIGSYTEFIGENTLSKVRAKKLTHVNLRVHAASTRLNGSFMHHGRLLQMFLQLEQLADMYDIKSITGRYRYKKKEREYEEMTRDHWFAMMANKAARNKPIKWRI